MKRPIPPNSNPTYKNLGLAFIAAVIVLFPASSCRVEEQREGDDIRNEQALSIAAYLYSEEGNCVHNYKQSTNLGRLTCSRAPRSRCDFYRHYSAAGTLPITSETQ